MLQLDRGVEEWVFLSVWVSLQVLRVSVGKTLRFESCFDSLGARALMRWAHHSHSHSRLANRDRYEAGKHYRKEFEAAALQ